MGRNGKARECGCNAVIKFINEKEDIMKNLTGKKWGEISEILQQRLLVTTNCIDGRTGNRAVDGECIVDFEGCVFSIAGEIVDSEIVIDPNSEFYNPGE